MALPTIAPYDLPELPASRVEWNLEARRAALLVHDMQAYFLRPYPRQASPLAPVLEHIGALRRAARAAGIPVFFSVQPGEQDAASRGLLMDMWGPGLARHPGTEAVTDLPAPQPHEHVVLKSRYSAFFGTNLKSLLSDLGRDQLVVTGVYGHIGCLSTAVDAFMLGIQPFFVGDAVADFSREDHEVALRQVARTCGRVLSAEAVLETLAAPR